MKSLMLIITGAILGTVIVACAAGSKSPSFSSFPQRSKEFSVWQKCADTYDSVCKNVCLEYTRKNECKKAAIEKLPIKEALDAGYVVLSRPYFLEILKDQ